MTRDARTDLATEAVEDLRRIVQVLRTSARRAERELGVSGAQLFVLQKLAEGPAGSINELAGRTLTHQSSVSVVVRRLAEQGLVARRPSVQDARRRQLHLTRAGERLLRRAPRMPQIDLIEGILALRRDDARALGRLLRKLVGAMGAAGMPPQMMFEGEGIRRRRPPVPASRSHGP